MLVCVASYIGVSFPEFVIATVLILLFADYLHLLPATGYIPLDQNFIGGLKLLILPKVTLSLLLPAHVSRMVRSEMLEVLQIANIRTPGPKGLFSRRVPLHPALGNGTR